MKKLSQYLSVLGNSLLAMLFVIFIVAGIRGIYGNPSIDELNSNWWKENGAFELSPERARYALMYSIAEEGSLFFSLPVAKYSLPDLGYTNDKYVSLFAPVISVLAVPGYLIGKYYGVTQVGVISVISVIALLNVLLIIAVSKYMGAKKWASVLAGAMFLFATPAFSYGVSLYQHHVSTFLILASIYLVIKPFSFKRIFLFWLMVGLSIPIDYPNAILMVPLILYSLRHYIKIQQSNVAQSLTINWKSVLATIAFLIPILGFLWFNNISYGSPFKLSGTVQSVPAIGTNGLPVSEENYEEVLGPDSKISIVGDDRSSVDFFEARDMINGLYILLFSKDRGLITFAPIMLLGVLGIFALYKNNQTYAALLASVLVATLLLYAMWGDPWGGWAYGSRYLIPAYAVLSISLSMFLEKYKRNIIALLLFLLIGSYSLYINTAGALSSSANPPEIQVLELELLSNKQERFSFDRNIEYLKLNKSKSFIYQTYLEEHITAWQYFEIISYSLIGFVSVITIILFLTDRKQK